MVNGRAERCCTMSDRLLLLIDSMRLENESSCFCIVLGRRGRSGGGERVVICEVCEGGDGVAFAFMAFAFMLFIRVTTSEADFFSEGVELTEPSTTQNQHDQLPVGMLWRGKPQILGWKTSVQVLQHTRRPPLPQASHWLLCEGGWETSMAGAGWAGWAGGAGSGRGGWRGERIGGRGSGAWAGGTGSGSVSRGWAGSALGRFLSLSRASRRACLLWRFLISAFDNFLGAMVIVLLLVMCNDVNDNT